VKPTPTEYKMPTATGVPVIRSILGGGSTGAGPFGAKGIGAPGRRRASSL
jgi:hypothetical protein